MNKDKKETLEEMLATLQEAVIRLSNKNNELKNKFLIQITEATYFDGTADPKMISNAKGYESAQKAMQVAGMYKWVDSKGNPIKAKVVTVEQAFRPLLQESRIYINNIQEQLESLA